MFKSLSLGLGMAIATGSLLALGSVRVQAMPESSELSKPKANLIDTEAVLEAANIRANSEPEITPTSTAQNSDLQEEVAATVEPAANANPRVPCMSRIFPTLMQ